MLMQRIEDAADKLRAMSEELADIAMDLLRNAVGAEDHERVEAANLERRVTRARRSVEKAVNLLDTQSSNDND
jgi:hypothetical protein